MKMNRFMLLTVVLLLVICGVVIGKETKKKGRKKSKKTFLPEGQYKQVGEIRHRFMFSGYSSKKLVVVNKENKVELSLPVRSTMGAWYLPDGGVIYADKEVSVVRTDAKGKEIWRYTPSRKGHNHACQPLPTGGFLLGQNVGADEHYAIELDKDGKLVKEVKLELTGVKDCKHTFRQFRKTKDNTYLGTSMRENKTREWDANGKLLRTFPVGFFVAVRLDNGNTLVTGRARGDKGNVVAEFDKDGKLVWEVTPADCKRWKLNIALITGLHRLPNGNTVICNLRHGASNEYGDRFANAFEVTRDKKLVWELYADRPVGLIQILDIKGDVYKGEVMR